MLTELINLFLSLFSLVLNETPRVSREEEISSDSDNSEDQWLPYIHEEYENVEDMASLSLLNEDVIAYTRSGTDELSEQRQRCFWKSFRKSIWTSLSTALVVLPLTAVAMLFLHFDLKTSDFCVEWQNHNNALPFSVQRLRFIGEAVEVILINFWCPLTFILLFGWKKFKAYFLFTFLVGLIFGDASVIYYYVLFRFGNIVARTHVYYRLPAHLLYFAGIICCSRTVLRNIRSCGSYRAVSNKYIIVLVVTEFVLSSLMAFLYRYAIVPAFISIKEEDYKFLLATAAPAFMVIPALICSHIALWRSSKVVHPGRSFVLAYIIRGGVIYIYRIMQAQLKSVGLFIMLSLLSSVSNFLKKATHEILSKLWRRIIGRFQCVHLLDCPPEHSRRLKADMEIQDMLFEYSSIVSNQCFLVLYYLESFEISMSSLFFESVKRIAIGMGIDLVFNCFSNFVQIHYYNIPVARVWKKCWLRHMLANLLVTMMIVSYTTQALLSAFQARDTGAKQYLLKNCTLF